MALTEKVDEQSQEEMSILRKEMGKSAQKVSMFDELKKLFSACDENTQICNEPDEDEELKEIAKDELESLEEQIEELAEDIVDVILPKSDADQRNCTIEVLQAAGGSESSLFAEDLFKMYQGYCRQMGFRQEQREFTPDMSINRGCKKGVIAVSGQDVYKHLKHESGVHKVQRVPETEKAGRIHSSTAIVLVVPEVPREFAMDMKDIRLDFMRAQGAGGQHVNKTDSACRATHTPTGIMSVSQEYRE